VPRISGFSAVCGEKVHRPEVCVAASWTFRLRGPERKRFSQDDASQVPLWQSSVPGTGVDHKNGISHWTQ